MKKPFCLWGNSWEYLSGKSTRDKIILDVTVLEPSKNFKITLLKLFFNFPFISELLNCWWIIIFSNLFWLFYELNWIQMWGKYMKQKKWWSSIQFFFVSNAFINCHGFSFEMWLEIPWTKQKVKSFLKRSFYSLMFQWHIMVEINWEQFYQFYKQKVLC